MMKGIKITALLIVTQLLFSLNLKAQDYKYEIGGMLGTSFYMGDANKTKPFKNLGPAGGVIFRYNKDYRWSFKSNLAVGHVSGETKDSDNKYPNGQTPSFSRNFYELGGQVEFNFFNYSNKYSYLDTKPFTPYAFIGIGGTYGSGEKSFWGLNIPFGLGLKYKWSDRINIGFEFSFRKLFGDNFDVTKEDGYNLDDPYKIDSGFFKNKDWYSMTMLSITWDFGVRCKPCLNID